MGLPVGDRPTQDPQQPLFGYDISQGTSKVVGREFLNHVHPCHVLVPKYRHWSRKGDNWYPELPTIYPPLVIPAAHTRLAVPVAPLVHDQFEVDVLGLSGGEGHGFTRKTREFYENLGDSWVMCHQHWGTHSASRPTRTAYFVSTKTWPSFFLKLCERKPEASQAICDATHFRWWCLPTSPFQPWTIQQTANGFQLLAGQTLGTSSQGFLVLIRAKMRGQARRGQCFPG